jgi:solute:Na+ symporter, SSS family
MLDLAIVLGFVALASWAGLRARRRASRSLEEYFLAGRNVRGWRAGLSMAATQYAADTPLLATGLVATGGIFLLWRFWIYGFGYLLLAFVFAELWRRSRVLTDAELTEARYSGPGVLTLRTLKAIYFGTLVNGFFLGMVLLAGIRIAQVFLPWHQWLPPEAHGLVVAAVRLLGLSLGAEVQGLPPEVGNANALLSLLLILGFVLLYSTLGGLRGVVVTDVIQFVFVMTGTLAYSVLVVKAAGGFDGMVPRLLELYGEPRSQELLGLFPSGRSVLLPFLLLIGIQGLFWIGSDGTGYLAQRAMACRSDHDARMAGVILAWVQILGRSLLWLLIGVGLLVVYPFTPADAASQGFAALREVTFVTGIRDLMPPGLLGIMLAGLLAALASTVDTHLNWGASYWTNDLYKRLLCQRWLHREPRERELVVVARLSNLAVLACALLIMVKLESIQATWFLSLLFGAGVGGVFMLRWLWHRINLWSEVAAIGVSLGAAPLLLVTVGEEWMRLAIMVLVTTGAAVGAAFLAPGTDPDVLEGFAGKVRPHGFWKERPGGSSARSMVAFLLRIRLALAMSVSLLLALAGLTRILVPYPGGSLLWPWAALLLAVALTPAWWPGLRSRTFEEERRRKSPLQTRSPHGEHP